MLSKFLAYSFQKSFTNGLAFLLLNHPSLRAFGFFHTLFHQIDWGQELGGESIHKRLFDCAYVQLRRMHKTPGTQNACAERTHRTDDEEFHAPTSTRILDLDDRFRIALQWTHTFNCPRPHFGRTTNGKTPLQRSRQLHPWVTQKSYLCPPLIFDHASPQHPLTGGQDLLATYSARACAGISVRILASV